MFAKTIYLAVALALVVPPPADATVDGSKRSKARLAISATHYNIMETTAVADAVEPYLSAKYRTNTCLW